MHIILRRFTEKSTNAQAAEQDTRNHTLEKILLQGSSPENVLLTRYHSDLKLMEAVTRERSKLEASSKR